MFDFAEFRKETLALSQMAWPTDKPSLETAEALLALLLEESGELSRAVRRYGQKRFGHPDEPEGTVEEIKAEIGDVLFVLARIANLFDIPLEEAAELVIRKISKRIGDI